MGPTLPPTNLDVLLLMGRVPGSSGVAASRYEFIFRSRGGSSLFSAEGDKGAGASSECLYLETN